MPNFTYLPDPEDPETVQTCGFSFTAGEWTPIPEDHAAVAKLRTNRFFAEEGSASGQVEPEQSDAASGTELQETGNGESLQPPNSGGDEASAIASEQVPSRGGPAIEITPLQCRAARAGLEWSREHLAELAKIGERTITDFERHASNMLRSKRTAIRKAFEAAGVIFKPGNGIWFTEPTSALAENSSETASATGAENQGGKATETDSKLLAA